MRPRWCNPLTTPGSFPTALSLNELKQLAPASKGSPVDHDLSLIYGVAQGSLQLRERIAEMHSSESAPLTAENVVITPGSIMANFLSLSTILKPGDHVICQYPTYGQLYLLPKYSEVDVTLWAMKEETGWQPNVDEITGLIKPNTKAIILKQVSSVLLPRASR